MNYNEQLAAEQRAYAEWLESLRPGDEVYVRGRSICKIRRTTNTQLIIEVPYDLRFRRSNGIIVGDGYDRLCQVTDAIRQQVKAQDNRVRLHRLTTYLTDSRSQLNDEQIAAMLKAYDDVQSIAKGKGA